MVHLFINLLLDSFSIRLIFGIKNKKELDTLQTKTRVRIIKRKWQTITVRRDQLTGDLAGTEAGDFQLAAARKKLKEQQKIGSIMQGTEKLQRININTVKTRKKLQCKKDLFSDIGYKKNNFSRYIPQFSK